MPELTPSGSEARQPAADAVELSAQDRTWLKELDDLRKHGDALHSLGTPSAIADLMPVARDLIDKLGVRRGAPGAEDKRRLIETKGNLPPETLGMLNHLATSGAEAPAQRHPDGLRDKELTASFAHEMKGFRGNWSALNAAARADAVGSIINMRLRDIGVPDLKIKTVPLGDDNGQFQYKDWSMEINELKLAASRIGEGKFGQVVNVVYHEARHAEQWFQIARLLTKRGVSPTEIARQTEMPLAICEAAAQAQPLTEAQVHAATVFYDSVYGRHSEHRDRVLDDYARFGPMLSATEQAYTTAASNPNTPPHVVEAMTDQYLRLHELTTKSHEAYEALPEEKDAWQVGNAAERAYRTTPAAGAARRPAAQGARADERRRRRDDHQASTTGITRAARPGARPQDGGESSKGPARS